MFLVKFQRICQASDKWQTISAPKIKYSRVGLQVFAWNQKTLVSMIQQYLEFPKYGCTYPAEEAC